MTITSMSFVLFILIGAAIYYIIPTALQWPVLFILSLAFYFLSATPYTIIYLIIATLIAYASGIFVDYARKKGTNDKAISGVVGLGITVTVIMWVVFKSKELWSPALSFIIDLTSNISWTRFLDLELLSALGMGYYTFQIIGYMLDCLWGTVEPQKNPLKLFLFTGYFPLLTTGPICRYKELTTLYEPHPFKYDNILLGLQRFIWGLAKKLVLAERVAVLMQNISLQAETEGGLFAILAILVFPLQIYADFSGCVDIVLGVSQIFGIVLPENFNNPFFSRNTQEFWQRWHITLGGWAKDYVLYPVLRSKGMSNISKFCKKKFGKKTGRLIATAIGTLAPWFVIALWHGSWRFLIGILLWNWGIITISSFLQPTYKKITDKLKIDTESTGWHIFQSVRTYILYAIGTVFFRLDVPNGFALLGQGATALFTPQETWADLFYLKNLLNDSFTLVDFKLVVVMVVALFIVAILREKHGFAREWVNKRFFLFRILIWIVLTFFVIIYAEYGPGYNMADFIYQGF